MNAPDRCRFQKRPKYSLNKQFENVKMRQVITTESVHSLFWNKNDFFTAIYNNFLTELWRLRLIAARETVEVINSAESTISGDIGQTPIKLAAEVCGLGPVFQVFLIIENMSARKVASDLCVLLHCDHRHYLLKSSYQKVKITFEILKL